MSLVTKSAPVCLFCALVVATMISCGGGTQQPRPQVSVSHTGDRYPPAPEKAPVKLFLTGEPDESYRQIGTVAASCPQKHWVRGNQKRGRPLCLRGLRKGARQLGGHAVVEIKTTKTQPDWAPEQTWLVLKGVVVRYLD